MAWMAADNHQGTDERQLGAHLMEPGTFAGRGAAIPDREDRECVDRTFLADAVALSGNDCDQGSVPRILETIVAVAGPPSFLGTVGVEAFARRRGTSSSRSIRRGSSRMASASLHATASPPRPPPRRCQRNMNRRTSQSTTTRGPRSSFLAQRPARLGHVNRRTQARPSSTHSARWCATSCARRWRARGRRPPMRLLTCRRARLPSTPVLRLARSAGGFTTGSSASFVPVGIFESGAQISTPCSQEIAAVPSFLPRNSPGKRSEFDEKRLLSDKRSYG